MNLTRSLQPFLALVFALVLGLASIEAQAARMGSGKSIGRQNSALTQRQAAPTQQAAPAPTQRPTPEPAAASAKQPSRWGGILGGLAAGLGLAALFHALGLGEGLASFLGSVLMIALFALAAFWLFSLLRQRGAPQQAGHLQYAGNVRPDYDRNALGAESHLGSALSGGGSRSLEAAPGRSGDLPADFDAASFLASAKQHYTRLQQAWDAADLQALRTFTTAEMAEALAAELQTRGSEPNKTEVVTLDAHLLALEDQGSEWLASVEFSGLVCEQTWGGASPVREVWNLVKPKDGSTGWLLAGIQQLN